LKKLVQVEITVRKRDYDESEIRREVVRLFDVYGDQMEGYFGLSKVGKVTIIDLDEYEDLMAKAEWMYEDLCE
jgi:hypothetical protein